VQKAKVGLVEFVSMKLLEEEERRIILNACNYMEIKYPDKNVIFHWE
jgi:hypothetical protein